MDYLLTAFILWILIWAAWMLLDYKFTGSYFAIKNALIATGAPFGYLIAYFLTS